MVETRTWVEGVIFESPDVFALLPEGVPFILCERSFKALYAFGRVSGMKMPVMPYGLTMDSKNLSCASGRDKKIRVVALPQMIKVTAFAHALHTDAERDTVLIGIALNIRSSNSGFDRMICVGDRALGREGVVSLCRGINLVDYVPSRK